MSDFKKRLENTEIPIRHFNTSIVKPRSDNHPHLSIEATTRILKYNHEQATTARKIFTGN